jgi:hypothetical protein
MYGGILTMSAKERERAWLVRQAMRGELGQRECARRLDIGVPSMQTPCACLARRGRSGADFRLAWPAVASAPKRGYARQD